jgi:L-ascorbate metabolism protein UlaG (beta-lactamase superfamily)
MKITYYGHSCFFVEAGGARLIIDPFLTGNSQAKVLAADVRCDYILISHGHEDHTGDALDTPPSSPTTRSPNTTPPRAPKPTA